MMIRIASGCSLFNPRISGAVRQLFSAQKPNGPRVQTVGFSNNSIQNIKALGYKLKQPIEYTNGKFLIYKSKFSFFRCLGDYFWHLLSLAIFSYLIYYRVNFNIYPIIKHFYVAGAFITFLLMASRFLRNHNVVKQIYLLEGGKASQVIFMNQMKRKLFGEMLQSKYYNSLFKPPKDQTLRMKFSNFPSDIKEIQKGGFLGKYWKKYYSNQDNFLLIPKTFQYIHPQIMIQVMNGKIIIQ